MPPLRSIAAAALAVRESPLVLRTADPILASDEALRIVFWNEGAEKLLGFSEDEVLGTPCCRLVGCASGPAALRYQCECKKLLDRDRSLFPAACDRELRTKSGERVWVNVTTIVTVSQTGLSVLVHLLRDLSRQHALEELLRHVASGAAGMALRPVDAAGTPAGDTGITAREREVIRLLAQGASTDAIASVLSITRRTTRNHIQNILGKLGVHSRLEAVACASTRGLL